MHTLEVGRHGVGQLRDLIQGRFFEVIGCIVNPSVVLTFSAIKLLAYDVNHLVAQLLLTLGKAAAYFLNLSSNVVLEVGH